MKYFDVTHSWDRNKEMTAKERVTSVNVAKSSKLIIKHNNENIHFECMQLRYNHAKETKG